MNKQEQIEADKLFKELLGKFQTYSDKEIEPNSSRQIFYFTAIMVEIAKKTDNQTNQMIALTRIITALTIVLGLLGIGQIILTIIQIIN